MCAGILESSRIITIEIHKIVENGRRVRILFKFGTNWIDVGTVHSSIARNQLESG